MRDAVRAAFYAFNAPMEGEVPWLYQDVKGLVSVGVGILCDPIQLALNLPLAHPDGRQATRNEIAAEWLRIKHLPPNALGQTAAQLGHVYARPHTTLRLTKAGLEHTMLTKANQMDEYLARRFPDYPLWNCDAQLGVLSLSWACGPGFRFPKCEAALRARDFRTAAAECFMPEELAISGLRPRNRANRILFLNAALSHELQLDPDVLYYPTSITSDPPSSDDVTEPSILEFPIVHPPVPLGDHVNDDEPPDEPPAAA